MTGIPASAGAAIADETPGHDLERHARRGERLRLLAAATEHERIAALEPHDALALPRGAGRGAARWRAARRSGGPARLPT